MQKAMVSELSSWNEVERDCLCTNRHTLHHTVVVNMEAFYSSYLLPAVLRYLGVIGRLVLIGSAIFEGYGRS